MGFSGGPASGVQACAVSSKCAPRLTFVYNCSGVCLQANRMKLITEVQVFGTMLITLVLKIPEQEARHSIAYGRLLLALNCAFMLASVFEFVHDEHQKCKTQRLLDEPAWDSAPPVFDMVLPEPTASSHTVASLPKGLDERAIKRAHQKFQQFDVDQSGTLQGDELVSLATWVFKNFHPDAATMDESKITKLARKIRDRHDSDGDGGMDINEFTEWYTATCARIGCFRKDRARATPASGNPTKAKPNAARGFATVQNPLLL